MVSSETGRIVPRSLRESHANRTPPTWLSYRSTAEASKIDALPTLISAVPGATEISLTSPAPTNEKPVISPSSSPTIAYPSPRATEDVLPRSDSGSVWITSPVAASHDHKLPSHVDMNTVPLLYAGDVPTAPACMKDCQTMFPVLTSRADM